MSYTPQTWTDNDPTTPLSGARLTHMESGISDAEAAAAAAAAAVAAEAVRAEAVEAAKADLVSGKVPASQLPAISIDHGVITVANAAARTALVIGTSIEPGQPVVQASTGQTFILADGATDTTTGSWVEIPAIGKVQSVNGQTGAVVLAASDVGAAPVATTTIDLVDRTNNTTETVPAGTTTNCATAGVTKTAPALAGTVGTPPLRFAVKNISTGSITVAYPDQAGSAQSLTMLTGETRTFRQKSTSGWGVESGALALSTLDARFLPQPASALTAGQMYGSDGAGNTVAVNPAELAYAENATGVTQAIASSATAGGGNFTAVTNCQIVVPASTRPVYIEASATVSFPTAPAALAAVTVEIVEVSNGVDTPITWSTNVPVSSQGQFNSVTVNFLARRLGTTARIRTFNLMVGDYQVALSVLNSAQQPSRIAAFAR